MNRVKVKIIKESDKAKVVKVTSQINSVEKVVAQALTRYKKEHGLSYQQLGGILKIPYATLARFARGDLSVAMKTFCQLVAYKPLGIKFSDLDGIVPEYDDSKLMIVKKSEIAKALNINPKQLIITDTSRQPHGNYD